MLTLLAHVLTVVTALPQCFGEVQLHLTEAPPDILGIFSSLGLRLLLLISYSGRQTSSNGMIFGAAYSHTDMLKMGCQILSIPINNRLSASSNLITAPPTAVNNLTIPTSYSDFMDQTEDGDLPR